MAIALTAAFGRTPHTAPLLDGARGFPLLDLRFEPVKPISRAFAPMVRQGRFDVSEMAIATFLMAKAAGKPLVLLPVTLAARFQEGALLCRAGGPVRGPADLAGKRVGVRAYSQTTGMWLRGVLAESFGVRPDAVRWVTFEDAHVAEYADPPFCERAPAGADLAAMLRDGGIDAAVFGNDLPEDPAFRPVFADVAAAGEAFRARYGFMPVNHLAVLRRDVVEAHPEAAAELVRLLAAPGLPSGRAALAAPIALASRWCAEQGLTPRALTLDEVWEGLPAGVG
ncbi:MAG: ABC transporter substrate-binding protein [Acetobacteraceae bacterium]